MSEKYIEILKALRDRYLSMPDVNDQVKGE